MAGLRCAEPSSAAWPSISAGVDAFVTVPDSAVIETMDRMRGAAPRERIDPGPSGACGLAALTAVALAPELRDLEATAGLDRSTRAMVIITEGT
jgi:diaminopropionate ammonia-lyase